MRLPHHLKIASNGVYYFRLSVPFSLRQLLGKKELVKSLGTRDPAVARLLAYGLSAKYLAEFRAMKKAPSLQEAVQAAKDGSPYTIVTPSGYTIKAEGEADHARAIEAIGKLDQVGALKPPPAVITPIVPVFAGQPIKLSAAMEKWVTNIKDKTKPKTLGTKTLPVRQLIQFLGDRSVHTITRTDLSDFCEHLQKLPGGERPTVFNKFVYLKGFFNSMMAKGHYPPGDNPAIGQISYSKKDKRAREGNGSHPFEQRELELIFNPETYLKLKQPSEYWAPLISLFTGARVNEVCQLALTDFMESEGYFCVSINDEEGRSTKNESSIRLVPLHSTLIKLGLKEYIEEVRDNGFTQLFPNLNLTLNGHGGAEGTAFIRYVQRLKIKAKQGTKSFHSFRDTVIHRLKEKKVLPEYRCQFVGHELTDPHFKYSGDFSMMELATVVHPALLWELDLQKLKHQPGHFRGRFAQARRKKQKN